MSACVCVCVHISTDCSMTTNCAEFMLRSRNILETEMAAVVIRGSCDFTGARILYE